jgi:hypothetical protein
MPTHIHIAPKHDGARARAQEIVHKLEAHLGRRATPTERGHRFELDDDDYERNANYLSGALDEVSPSWRYHVEMGL